MQQEVVLKELALKRMVVNQVKHWVVVYAVLCLLMYVLDAEALHNFWWHVAVSGFFLGNIAARVEILGIYALVLKLASAK